MIRELETIDEFRDAVRRGVPILITDKTTGHRLHPSAQGCEHVLEDHFIAKVIVHEGKNGGYYEVTDLREAQERWPSAVGCWI